MKHLGILALTAALTVGLFAPAAAAPDPASCQGLFLTRGACVIAVAGSNDQVTLSVGGTAYGATETLVAVRLEDAATGEILVQCSAGGVGTLLEMTCGETVELPSSPSFVGTCVAEGILAGRFFCDALRS
ncbi:MAG TPA: hypothetical protein VGB64_04895 [Actinomycetota bacterium]